ncbi:MAG: response regulator [Phycisphaerae bacterium]|nr:response regulator [Phycisphaerae bacterium]
MSSRVLVVDDSAFMRKMLKDILVGTGCDVVAEAADGAEAVSKYRELRPDLVTLDMIMPVKGGLEALTEIRELDPDAHVIVISAVEQRQPLMEALKHGAADYIVKPFERDRVEEAVRRVLGQ